MSAGVTRPGGRKPTDGRTGLTTMETATNQDVMERLATLYEEVFYHDGYGEIRLEMKILRRGQKEVIIHCGKQYRFVVDYVKQPAMG